MKFRRAILYVAWGERFVLEATASAQSAEKTGVDTLLFTNRESMAFVPADAPFARVIPHEFRLGGNRAKTEIFGELPDDYNSFLFLDTDTTILLAIDQAFDRAEQHGIAAAQAAHYSLEHYGGLRKILDQEGFRSDNLIHYNSGVVFFTKAPQVMEVLSRYRALCAKYESPFDQPFLTLAMEQLGFNPYTLSIAYNYRNFGELISGEVRIWHSHSAPPADVNEFSRAWPPRRFRHGQRLEEDAD